ncbi:riboflavin biosynthesis protein RibF [Chlamydiales bacterium]|nr:riboflavin biosynthesis protein RibF [Chlamydiales bacterium]
MIKLKIMTVPYPLKPNILICGMFDGVHLGHQKLLEHAVKLAKELDGISTMITFENHPKTVLSPDTAPKLIQPISQKLHIIKNMGIDQIHIIPFTDAFSKLTAAEFIQSQSLTHFILGYDTKIGSDKLSGAPLIELLNAQEIKATTIKPVMDGDTIISSRLIRELIQQGSLDKLHQYLGRPYSLYGPIIPGQSIGRTLGVPTLNLSLKNLTTLPFGVYATIVKSKNEIIPAVVNLGIAPTLKKEKIPQLEVHLLKTLSPFPDRIEISFLKFFRKEILFDSKDALVKQIQIDIKKANQFLKNYL